MGLFDKFKKTNTQPKEDEPSTDLIFEVAEGLRNKNDNLPTFKELEEQFSKEEKDFLADRENFPNPLEYMFKGACLDCIEFVKTNFNIDLDFTEESIKKIELILDDASKSYNSGLMPEELFPKFARRFAAYVGILIQIHKGGYWVEEVPEIPDAGPAIKIEENYYFVVSKVHRRILNGDEDNVYHFYLRIPYAK